MGKLITCDACHQDREESMFGYVPGGEQYVHLGLNTVCKLCQVKHKVCSHCRRILPASLVWFYPKPSGKFKLYHVCKACRSVAAAQYNRLNKKGKIHAASE